MQRLLSKLERGRHRAVLRDRRPLPQPPPRPDRRGEPRAASRRPCAEHRRRVSASPSTATPTASAPSTSTATVVWGDQLMLIYGREILTRKPGATFIGEVKCSQVMYDELKRLGGNADHVQDRPLAHQGQDEGGARRTRRRNERPHVLRRPLLRLRRRPLRRLPPDRDRGRERQAAFGATARPAEDGDHAGDSASIARTRSSSRWSTG